MLPRLPGVLDHGPAPRWEGARRGAKASIAAAVEGGRAQDATSASSAIQ
jgi:hypothetical protein